jgi:tripartite-type tricarboxylate transporter receptor subunit TctC
MKFNMPHLINKRLTQRSLILLVLSLGCFFVKLAHSAWPNDQPINLIVAYAPGGGTDMVARQLVPYLERSLGRGVHINVINKVGAGGEIGFMALASAAPDGYTLGFINTPPIITIPIEHSSNWNINSFDLLGNVVDDPGTFCVHIDSPIKSLSELAAYAKSSPGIATLGSTGVGSDDHLAMLLFEKAAGVKMTHIPFKGSAEVRSAIIGKHITVGAINVGEALQYLKGGSPIRCLGQMTASRISMTPDWPTFREQGFNFEMASLRGVAAPKGLPATIKLRLAQALEDAINDPSFKQIAEQGFSPIRFLAPSAYISETRAADTLFRQLWKEIPWTEK